MVGISNLIIVIVIRCQFFFTESGTLIFAFFGIIISNADTPCLRSAFAPKIGGKAYPKRDEKVPIITYPFSG